jgi:hypothetical protein
MLFLLYPGPSLVLYTVLTVMPIAHYTVLPTYVVHQSFTLHVSSIVPRPSLVCTYCLTVMLLSLSRHAYNPLLLVRTICYLSLLYMYLSFIHRLILLTYFLLTCYRYLRFLRTCPFCCTPAYTCSIVRTYCLTGVLLFYNPLLYCLTYMLFSL